MAFSVSNRASVLACRVTLRLITSNRALTVVAFGTLPFEAFTGCAFSAARFRFPFRLVGFVNFALAGLVANYNSPVGIIEPNSPIEPDNLIGLERLFSRTLSLANFDKTVNPAHTVGASVRRCAQ